MLNSQEFALQDQDGKKAQAHYSYDQFGHGLSIPFLEWCSETQKGTVSHGRGP
jgi:hypothetical protein